MAISTGSSGGSSVNAEINVTPMIDVMLVLLIIFMIVTPLLASGFTATMPVADSPTVQAEGDDEVTLGVDNTGAYFVNGKPVSAEVAEQQLTSIYAGREEDKLLYFKADAGLPYSKVQAAVEVGRRAGARVLVAIVDKRGGLSGDSEE
ncbi:MAG: biopolymer transporter ExbD [Gemmatimonadota bacterium]